MRPPKLTLAHVPTPLWRSESLDRLVGTEVWVKRDDMTAGPCAGNKIRKLEYLLADAQARHATTVLTCGGFQSNHCRATAILARQLGMRAVLFLRTAQTPPPVPDRGNAFLDRLTGAEIRTISPAQYAERTQLMAEAARTLERAGERPYVIPEGGSNGLGALGYVDAMREVRAQLDRDASLPRRFDAVAHACGSGGTAAGVVLGSEHFGVAPQVIAMAVCDDRAHFEGVVQGLVDEASDYTPGAERAAWTVVDAFKGPAYAVASEEQLDFIASVARASGLILDPVYTGKALFGLAHSGDRPERVLFIHTGGLPGLLAQASDFSDLLAHPT